MTIDENAFEAALQKWLEPSPHSLTRNKLKFVIEAYESAKASDDRLQYAAYDGNEAEKASQQPVLTESPLRGDDWGGGAYRSPKIDQPDELTVEESCFSKQVRLVKEDMALMGGLLPHEQIAHAKKREAYIVELETCLKRESAQPVDSSEPWPECGKCERPLWKKSFPDGTHYYEPCTACEPGCNPVREPSQPVESPRTRDFYPEASKAFNKWIKTAGDNPIIMADVEFETYLAGWQAAEKRKQTDNCTKAFEEWAKNRPALVASSSRLNAKYVWEAAWTARPTTRESIKEWQPPHDWHHYGMGIIRSRLLEDHVYLQGKNGDVWRVWLEMDGTPSIECIERNANLPYYPMRTVGGVQMSDWQPIETAPRKYVHGAADHCPIVWLWIPELMEMHLGYYSPHEECFRYDADDGPKDCQPTMWFDPTKPMYPTTEIEDAGTK